MLSVISMDMVNVNGYITGKGKGGGVYPG